ATHAYVAHLRESNRSFDTFFRRAEAFYAEHGVLSNGSRVTDPERVTDEAIGQYVASRIQSMYSLLTELRAWSVMTGDTGELMSPEARLAGMRRAVEYHRSIQHDVYGYQEESWSFSEGRVATAMPEWMRE